jgi:hypothetical protein
MMTKQYKSLVKETKKIDKVVKSLQNILFELLSTEAKDLEIGVGDKAFKFCQPSDLEDKSAMDLKKCELITLILRDAFDRYFDEMADDKVWANVFALAQGQDPKDHQIEKFDLKDVYDVSDGVETETGHIALPLNEDNYQVKQEIEDIVDDLSIEDLEVKFDKKAQKKLKRSKAYPEDK